MIADGDPHIWALVIGFLAVMNWLMGARSVLGHRLLLRNEISFRIFRWAGLCLFVTAWILRMRLEWEPFVWFAYAGAGMMLIGTAKSSEKTKPAEQAGADQPATAPESKAE